MSKTKKKNEEIQLEEKVTETVEMLSKDDAETKKEDVVVVEKPVEAIAPVIEETAGKAEEPEIAANTPLEVDEKEKEVVQEDSTKKPKEVLETKKAKFKYAPPRLIKTIGVEIKNVTKNKQVISKVDSDDETKKNNEILAKYLEYKDKGEIIWGRIIGTELDEKSNMVAAVCMDDDNQKILIPDMSYFLEKTEFQRDYEKASKKEKMLIRQKFISYQTGAIICFVISNAFIDREYGLTVIGDRVTALKKMQDYYFTHKEFPQTKENTVEVGNIVEARVLSVRSFKVFVECCGVETFIAPFYLSNGTINNCKEVCKPGDILKLKVRKFYTSPENYISLTARSNASEEDIRAIKKNSTYLGTIEKINKTKKIITVRLENGVNVSVFESNVYNVDVERLAQGDKVIVSIFEVLDTRAYGRIITKI